MHPGDFIIAPAWTWHDHGSPGSEPVVWLDGLNIPIVSVFEVGFAENDTRKSQPSASLPLAASGKTMRGVRQLWP